MIIIPRSRLPTHHVGVEINHPTLVLADIKSFHWFLANYVKENSGRILIVYNNVIEKSSAYQSANLW